jgi:hypothetical protein
MISVGPGRASARCGGWQSVKGIGRQHPIHGRQGKSAASGRAQVVGWVGCFRYADVATGWRFRSNGERFQRSKRHRSLLEPTSTS